MVQTIVDDTKIHTAIGQCQILSVLKRPTVGGIFCGRHSLVEIRNRDLLEALAQAGLKIVVATGDDQHGMLCRRQNSLADKTCQDGFVEVVSALAHCWSLIDYSHRLRRQIPLRSE